MSRSIKAKSTFYNGVQFRSRTEARWARLFDYLGVQYDYEPECYEFDGEFYIPDFYIHSESPVFMEIKPISEYREFDESKIIEFAKRGHTTAIIYGLPNRFEMNLLDAWETVDGEESFEIYEYCKPGIVNCRWCKSVGLADKEWQNIVAGHLRNLTNCDYSKKHKEDTRIDWESSSVLDAFCDATSKKPFSQER